MPDESGTVLWRGRRPVDVTRCADAFTVVRASRRGPPLLDTLRAVERSDALTPTVTRITVAPVQDLEAVRDELMDELRGARVVTHHIYVPAGAPQAAPYPITDEAIVAFAPGTGEDVVAAVLTEAGVQLRRRYGHLPDTYLVRITWEAGANPLKVCARLMEHPQVRYAEPAIVNQWRTTSLPADDLLPEQWHLLAPDRPAPDIADGTDIGAAEAWRVTRGRRDVVVAVLDDGFDLTHPDLAGDGKVVHPVDFAGSDAVPHPEPGDFHGTPCAGLAVAEAEGTGCVGVAPGAALMPVRIPMNLPDPWLIEIFRTVSEHASVASCSFGPVPGDFPLHSAVFDTLTDVCATGGRDGTGLVVAVAAGNYDAPLDVVTTRPITFDGGAGHVPAGSRVVNGLAAHPGTVTVAAYTSLGRRAEYSGWGREVSVAAPGNNFEPVYGAVLAGRGITTTDNEVLGDGYTAGKRFTSDFGGTSAACAIVAGVAALVRSADPALSASEVRLLLERTARKIEDRARDALFGVPKGMYDGGHSLGFGFGWVDARAAVAAAVAGRRPDTVLTGTSSPRAGIPDAFPPGLADVVQLPGPGIVARAEVEVDIAHPWPGDLRLVLTSPSGTDVVLADRWVTGGPDLHGTFAPDRGDPQLAALRGEAAGGAWVLHVSDLAPGDVGELRSWALRLHLAEATATRVAGPAGTRLPAGATTTVEVDVAADVPLGSVALHVDVGHPLAHAVRVTLVSPTGDAAVLREGTGTEERTRLRETFTSHSSPALATLGGTGQVARGTWRLDLGAPAGHGGGKLNAWWLDLFEAP